MSAGKVEVIATRDPDGPGTVDVFVDGVQVEAFVEVWVDPGAGWALSDWRERTAAIAGNEDYSPAFRARAIALMGEAEGSEYIDVDVDDDDEQ